MDRETRLAWLLDHYRRPRYRGVLPDADARVPGGNPGCGDIITMSLKDGEVRWEGTGCTLSQAAASILAERVNTEKMTFEEILAMPPEAMIELLGRGVAAGVRAPRARHAQGRGKDGRDESQAQSCRSHGRADRGAPPRLGRAL